jgi:hypothetical protein
MFALASVLFFAAAAIVHGGAVTVHTGWLDWQGLALAGLLCLSLTGYGPAGPPWLPRRRD